MSFRIISIFIVFLLAIHVSFAQDRQGNIVEYFGKEKVESIEEGSVLHVFMDGLVLGNSRFSFNNENIPTNPIFSKALNNSGFKIFEGKEEDTDLLGNKSVWQKISVNEKNEFDDRSLRGGGCLYIEFESPNSQPVLFEASGHTDALINGLPHEGDYYDYGWSLIPVNLKRGVNTFILRGGRFPNIRARLLQPYKPVQFTKRDITLPDILLEENEPLYAAIRVINTNDSWFKDGSITCKVKDAELNTSIPSVAPMLVRKVPFRIPVPKGLEQGERVKTAVILKNKQGNVLAIDTLEIDVKSKYKHHKRTFISNIDGSVQYYSVAPCSNPDIEKPAMFLSVHGASVEAVNQARAYKQKDWGHLVAPTNRRPYGYAWENWGRLDAIEVLNRAEKLLGTDPEHTYLTGHSMGGHGTWQLGVTYPDRFAAIAPCAGYPDLKAYSNRFLSRIENMSDEQAQHWGIDKDKLMSAIEANRLQNAPFAEMDSMIERADNPGRSLKLKRNYLHYGVFIYHGEKDNVVPTDIAREMRAELGKFHPDFTYYEYPGGSHWFSDQSVDWPPLFDFFKARSLKDPKTIDKYEFYTASPGVSSKSNFIGIIQQIKPLEISSFNFNRKRDTKITTENAKVIALDVQKMGGQPDTIIIDQTEFILSGDEGTIYFEKNGDEWQKCEVPSLKDKGPHRNGGFKNAFTNNVVLVYATHGSKSENEWYFNRARFDAEKFYYLGNGSFEVIKDSDFTPEKYTDRNVVLYGNRDNNSGWKKLLKNCPVQVTKKQFTVGDKELKGDQWAGLFIYPRPDSDKASVGVVTATGEKGMKAAFGNDYLGRPAYPDFLLFDDTMMCEGISGIKCAGFFGNDWSVKNGDFVWKLAD
jgi:pimeloyl-ACP methyl ester carboxylesterase